jgi:hypothetical protein
MSMTFESATADGVWLPLPEAAAALGCSVDTVRRRIKRGQVDARMAGTRYMVHVATERAAATAAPLVVSVEDVHPSVRLLLEYVRERDQVRDQELAQLREELARTRADLMAAQSMLPPANGKPWGPFAWLRQLWAAQT